MVGYFLSRTAFTGLGLVLACSSGDLTLPGPNEPAAPEPGSLRIVSGDDQRADPGALLEEPLKVQVLDAGGQPMADVPVQFSFLEELPNAGLVPSSTPTDPQGHATAFARLGSVPGEQLIAARVAGTESPNLTVSFRATALPVDDGGGEEGGGGDDNGGGGGDGSGDEDDGSGGGGSDDDDDEGSGGDDDEGSGGDDVRASARLPTVYDAASGRLLGEQDVRAPV